MKYLSSAMFVLATSSVGFGNELPLTRWERAVPGEVEQAEAMSRELIQQIQKEYARQGKRVFRDAHPRGIGCVEAKFTVSELPAEMAQYQLGVFAEPGKTYDAIIRFSTALRPAGDQHKDARGMAIKLVGVPGQKLLEEQPGAVTQDFLQINGPFFPAKNAKEFGGIVHIQSNPASLPGFLAGAPILRAYELRALLNLSTGNPFNGKSLLSMTFNSMVPYGIPSKTSRGEVATPIKFASRPCYDIGPRRLNGTDTELRDDLQERLEVGEACFQFGVQVYNPNARKKQDIEDGMSEWLESDSPYTQFATITIPPQTFKTDERLRYCDNLSFQPWHTVATWRPLGNINRARKIVYETISKSRHLSNRETSQYLEPVDLSVWRGLTSPDYDLWRTVKVPQVP